jgi:hypothetical protein
MVLSERKLRIGGHVVFGSILFVFFMMEMFFSWKDEDLLPKVFAITVLHSFFIWEPTRFIILQMHKRFAGAAVVRKRIMIALLMLVPYSFFIGFTRIYIEDATNLWGVPVASFSTFWYTIGITLLFVLLELTVYESFYFFQEWKRTISEAEELKRLHMHTQMETLRNQIQPHFLFNTLNTLIGLIEADQSRAVRFTETLAFVYRYLLETGNKILIPLEEELHFARRYFSLLKTRYPEGLFLTEDIEEETGLEVPPMALQVLIENAVKHNKISKARPLRIHIAYDAASDEMLVTNNSQPKHTTATTGVGLENLRKKLELLNLPGLRVDQNAESFCVRFPLAKTPAYESIDH